MKHHQITSEERYTIGVLRREKKSLREIARCLGRSPSTISREIIRNKNNDGSYCVEKADSRTRGRRSRSRRNLHFGPKAWGIVEEHLRLDWSPEQVSAVLKRDGILSISHETIYKYVWADKRAGGDLWCHLRQRAKRRRKRYGAYDSRGKLAGKRHISERPEEVEGRTAFGHWEADTIKGDSQAVHSALTCVERSTGLVYLGKLERHKAGLCAKRMVEMIRLDPKSFKSITADNGTEFHDYEDVEWATRVPFYFATPYHSWERGTNENTNGLIRQYLPKGQSMKGVTQRDLNAIADRLNSRPRKRLGWRTPEDCYLELRESGVAVQS